MAGDTLGTRDTVASNTNKPFIAVGTRAISGNSIIYKNGQQMATAASDATLLNTTTKFGIGQHQVSTAGGQFVGEIMEAMVYTGVLTAANRNKIDSYLALKYGITLDQTSATNYVLSG